MLKLGEQVLYVVALEDSYADNSKPTVFEFTVMVTDKQVSVKRNKNQSVLGYRSRISRDSAERLFAASAEEAWRKYRDRCREKIEEHDYALGLWQARLRAADDALGGSMAP